MPTTSSVITRGGYFGSGAAQNSANNSGDQPSAAGVRNFWARSTALVIMFVRLCVIDGSLAESSPPRLTVSIT